MGASLLIKHRIITGKMKLNLVAAILLATINSAEAQPKLGDTANNPIFIRAIGPLLYCEETITRENSFLITKDKKKTWSLIKDGCAEQIDTAIETCEIVSDYDEDDCTKIIDHMLGHHYDAIVKDLIRRE